jgi:hypothetical protein
MLLFFSFRVQAQLKIRQHYKIKNTYEKGGPLLLRYTQREEIVGSSPKKYWTKIITKVIAPRREILGISSSNLKANLKPDSSGKVKVDFWSIIKDVPAYRNNPLYVNSTDTAANFYFQISKRTLLSEPISYKSIPYVNYEVGAITIPFKYWFKNNAKEIQNNTSTEINAGVYVGRKWGRKRFYYDSSINHESASFILAAFGGPSKIELTKEMTRDSSEFRGNSNELALSLGSGAMYSYRDFNIGLFGGWDLPMSTAGRNWMYANRFWFGFGIGFSLKMFNGGK